jgi:hypothetical protein
MFRNSREIQAPASLSRLAFRPAVAAAAGRGVQGGKTGARSSWMPEKCTPFGSG